MEETKENTTNIIEKIDRGRRKIIRESEYSKDEIRMFTDYHYQIQDMRIAVSNQIRSIKQNKDTADQVSFELLEWHLHNLEVQEAEFKKILDDITNNPLGSWLKQVKGIGPALAACLLSYFEIDLEKGIGLHAGSFHTYAGLNDNNRPWYGKKAKAIVNGVSDKKELTLEDLINISAISNCNINILMKDAQLKKNDRWNKEKVISNLAKPPYNIYLKKKCWQCGQQFVKVSNNKDSLYGRIYAERKAYELDKNEKGEYADQAARILREVNIGKNTDAYKAYSEGKLPPAHIQARAERYAVKLFISHLYEAMYISKYQKTPENPYVIQYCGHSDYIAPEVPFDSLWK